MKHLIVICLIIVASQGYSQGQIDGFYRGQHNFTSVLGFGYEDNKDYRIGREPSELKRTTRYINIFTAYGITDHLDIQVSIPYIENDRYSQFQDLTLFAKYRFIDKPTTNGKLQFSFGLGFSTPLSDYAIGGLFDIGQQATVIDSRALLHFQWNSSWFITAQSGFSFKFVEVPNSLPVVLKIGHAGDKWYYDLFYDSQYAFGGIDYRGTPSPQNFRELGVDYHKLGATLYRNIYQNFGAYISYANIVDGRNTFLGPSYGVGLVYDFR